MWICANMQMMKSPLGLTKNHGPCPVISPPSHPGLAAPKPRGQGQGERPVGPALTVRTGRLYQARDGGSENHGV